MRKLSGRVIRSHLSWQEGTDEQVVVGQVPAYPMADDRLWIELTAGNEEKNFGPEICLPFCIDNLKEADGNDPEVLTVRQKELGAILREAFACVAASYQAGIDYQAALNAALANPVFDERENALREAELFRTVLADVKDQKSGIGSYIIGDVTAALKQSYVQLNAVRLGALTEARENEWDIQLRELNERQESFNRQMNAIYSRGAIEWRKANRRIEKEMVSWQEQYVDSFKMKDEAWTNQYITFLQKKEAWVDDLAEKAVHIGNNEILRNMGESTRDAIADASSFIIADVIELPDMDAFLAGIVDRNLLSGLLASAAERNAGIGSFTPAIFQTLKRDAFNSAETLEKIRVFQTEQDEQIAARLAFIQYDQALNTLREAKESLEENVEDANRATWEGFYDMFVRSGFKESGGNFVKNTIVGATLLDTLREKHVIAGYKYYPAKVKDFTKGIKTPEEIDLETIGALGIQALLEQAMGSVDEEMKRIFGDEKDTTYVTDSVGTNKKVSYNNLEKTKKQYDEYIESLEKMTDKQSGKEAQTVRYRKVASGEFNAWVGYAPVFRDDADPGRSIENYEKNVRFAGSGETGRIMGMFIQHKMIEGAGMAEGDMPAYSRRLWDDRGSFMAAPTLRSLTDIAVTIAANAIAPGAGGLLLNTALNMIDDAIFTMLDISNGMDPLDAMESFGKKAVTSYVSGKIGQGFNGIANAEGVMSGGLLQTLDLTDSVIGSTLLKGTELMASNIASSAVNSISVRGLMSGGDFFNEKAFMEGSFGNSALAGVAAGMAGNAVTVGMNNWNLGKDAMKVDLFNSGQISQMKALNSFVGGLTQSGITYGLTGNATFNVARVLGTGVMEMHVGKDGFGMNFGMSGTDISMGTIATAIQGAQHWRYNSRIESRADQLDLDIASALRSQYGFGDIMARKQLDSILDGTTDVKERKGEAGEAESVTENGKKVVYLDNYRKGMSREEQLRMGITLQHEAWRDGVVDENNKEETVMAVYAHTKMTERVEEDNRYSDMMKGIVAGDELLTADRKNMAEVDNDIVKFAGYVLEKYDSSKDYWKLKLDGTIEWDGSKDLNVEYLDENGEEQTKYGHIKDTTGSFSQSLAQYVGAERAEQILGSSVNDLNLYDNQTLMDVFGMTAEGAQAIRGNTAAREALLAGMSSTQKEKLTGEALMKKTGMKWGSDGWTGGPDFSVAMTDVDNLGQVVINKNIDENGNVSYDRFAVSAVINRDVLSMYSLRKSTTSKDYQGLDTMTLFKRDLNGNFIDSSDEVIPGWQTVVNGYIDGSTARIKAYTEDTVFRGSTIAADQEFYMRFGNFGGHKDFGGTYFILNRAQTIDGTSVSINGNIGDRWLGHSNYLNKYNRSDNGGLISAGCFINDMNTVNSVQDQLNNWGINYSYDVKAVIKQEKYEEEYWKWIY